MWFFEYDTPKYITISSKNHLIFGILYRLFQLIILAYIIGYAIVWKKGYQEFDTLESAVASKVKGVVLTNFSADEFDLRIRDQYQIYNRIWDVSDLVVPPMENGAFFITTNVIITPNQSKGACPEDPDIDGAHCTERCPIGVPLLTGVTTGRCIPSALNHSIHVCEVNAWCPVEKDYGPLKDERALLAETENFTVLIKNFVEFRNFRVRRRNIIQGAADLKSCRYHPQNDKLCPIFRLGDIIDNIEDKTENDTYEKLAYKGGVIAIEVNWDCNLDFAVSKCLPTYSFRRLDDTNALSAPGWNFRYSHYDGTDETRTLYKATGILFVILVQGVAGQFRIVPLLMNIGAGIGLLTVASVLTDIIVLYISKDRKIYRDRKYEPVDSSEETPILRSEDEAAGDGYRRMKTPTP